MNNKLLVRLFLPAIDKQYDIWLPINKTIYNIIILLLKGINEMNDDIYHPDKLPILYNKTTGKPYDINSFVNDTDIKNGTELILL